MAARIAAARAAMDLSRLGSSQSAAFISRAANSVQRRGLAGGGDHHGPPKVNFWQDPLNPSKWKEEHVSHQPKLRESLNTLRSLISSLFVIVSLTGWGLVFYGGYKFFTGGKKEKKEEKSGEASN